MLQKSWDASQATIIADWLAEKTQFGQGRPCLACGRGDGPALDEDVRRLLHGVDQFVPAVSITCMNCGFMMFFNANVVPVNFRGRKAD